MIDSQPETWKKRATIFLVAFAVMLCVVLVWTHNRIGSIDDPVAPWNVDGIFYDNIAFNLRQANGFSVDLDASGWREVYISANSSDAMKGAYDWLLPVKGRGPTALRSPAYPFVLAAIYKVRGHRFEVARILGCVFVATGIALLLTFVAVRWSLLAGIIAGTTLSLDYSVMQSAATLATESLAVLIFASTFLLVVRAWENPSSTRWAVAGTGFATLILTRGIWNLGLMILASTAVLVLVPAFHRNWQQMKPRHLFAFLAVAMILVAPWWVRNCRATDHFTPFGTAGACGFVGGYCDESLQNYGQWQPEVFNRNQIEVQKNFDMNTADLAKVEYAVGKSSMTKTFAWCKENLSRLPELMVYRALSHWGFFNPSVPTFALVANTWLVVIGLAGCFLCTGKLKQVFIVVLILDTVLVMLTWEHLGRYAIPIRPIVHVGYGLAMATLLQWLSTKLPVSQKHSL